MDEKTIPLQRISIKPEAYPKHPPQIWGADSHYRALFEQTGECVFIISLELRYSAANQQALQLLGYQEYELIGMPVSEIMSLEEGTGHNPLIGNASGLYERILKRKDGTKVPVEISTSFIYDEYNRPSCIQSIARDISERKQTERILKRQASILSTISDATARLLRTSNIETKIPEVLESLGRAIDVPCCLIFDVDIFSANPSSNIQYQWRNQNLPEIEISTLVDPLIPSFLNNPLGSFSSETGKRYETPPPRWSFAIVPIHGMLGSGGFLGLFDPEQGLSWSPSERDAIQTAADLIGSALQRNQYEETIRLNEARNRIIIDALPDLIIRIDVDRNILDYSTNPGHPLYIHRDVISGRKLTQTWPEETVEHIIGVSNKASFTSPNWVGGFHLPYSNSIYEARLSPISAREALIVVRDVTEQERLNEAKSDFINRASHELRTPLTSVILMTELIQGGGTPEELDEYWQVLNSELNRQKILIDRLLIAGRLENGMMKLENNPLDLVSVLQESVLAVKPIANKRRVSIQLTSKEEPAIIKGDRSGLQQVFINLINNAVKFSSSGGQVSISIVQNQGEALVHVMDSGLGIPPAALPHLFERFYRAKNVTIAEIPGSGIGLYIVKSIVDELGGKITVESELNKGTTFTVALKRA